MICMSGEIFNLAEILRPARKEFICCLDSLVISKFQEYLLGFLDSLASLKIPKSPPGSDQTC